MSKSIKKIIQPVAKIAQVAGPIVTLFNPAIGIPLTIAGNIGSVVAGSGGVVPVPAMPGTFAAPFNIGQPDDDTPGYLNIPGELGGQYNLNLATLAQPILGMAQGLNTILERLAEPIIKDIARAATGQAQSSGWLSEISENRLKGIYTALGGLSEETRRGADAQKAQSAAGTMLMLDFLLKSFLPEQAGGRQAMQLIAQLFSQLGVPMLGGMNNVFGGAKPGAIERMVTGTAIGPALNGPSLVRAYYGNPRAVESHAMSTRAASASAFLSAVSRARGISSP